MAHNGWGIYGLNGWGSYGKVSCCFVWKYAQKKLVFREVPFPVIAWPQVLVPLNCQRGPTMERVEVICGAQLSVEFHSVISSWTKWGWGSIGGAILILTRRMDEPAYGHSSSHPGGASERLIQCTLNWWFFRWTLRPVLWQLSHGKYISLCVSRGQQALNGSG